MLDEKSGVILKGIGGFYYVLCDGIVEECKAGGRFRKGEISPVAGDRVKLNGELIVEIAPRRNYFVRPPIANIDKLFIAATEAMPKTDSYLIDKMTVIALQQGVEPIILLTKHDVSASSELEETYQKAGFKVIVSSAYDQYGVLDIQNEVKDCICVFAGNSGVGKSSIINAAFEGFMLEIGDISQKISRGKHTTRTTEFFPLPQGGIIADTPGFSSFDLTRMHKIKKEELMHLFPEFEAFWNQCRFQGCSHRKEPDCAVKQGVEQGIIPLSRYENYVKLYEELAAVKEW